MKKLESLEHFQGDQIENLENTVGGNLVPTCWRRTDGSSGNDMYDDRNGILIYLSQN